MGLPCVLYIFPHYEVGIIVWNCENDGNAVWKACVCVIVRDRMTHFSSICLNICDWVCVYACMRFCIHVCVCVGSDDSARGWLWPCTLIGHSEWSVGWPPLVYRRVRGQYLPPRGALLLYATLTTHNGPSRTISLFKKSYISTVSWQLCLGDLNRETDRCVHNER